MPALLTAAPVAQWIEHQPPELRATGSNPVRRTIKIQHTHDVGSSPLRISAAFPIPQHGGPLAQLVEQLTLNQRAVGSTPTRPTKFFNHFRILLLDYVNLVPTFGAKFSSCGVQEVYESLFATRQPLRIVLERGRRLGMAQLLRDIEQQRHVARHSRKPGAKLRAHHAVSPHSPTLMTYHDQSFSKSSFSAL